MTDYNETWLQAMDILISKRLSEISFDRTISATIEDASRADEGIYLVSTGNAKFTAYSRDSSYRVNDTVMVTIPEGDYDKQKMIIGKQVKNQNDTPISYRSPFQNFINISNNLIKGFSSNFGMYANGQDDAYKWSEGISDFLQSEAWVDYQENKLSLYSSNEAKLWQSDIERKIKVIWDSGELREPIMGYSMLGIQAQFSTWLADYDTAAGNYGVAAVLELRNPDNPSAKPYYTTAIFDSDEFFGDVYNFESFYTQEKVFDISNVAENANITHITLLAYQRGNFVQADGAPVPTPADNDFSDIGPNIWIKDSSISFGMSIDDFKGDSATLLCFDSSNYYKDNNNNIKQINLRWVHKDDKTELISTMELVPEGYEVRWYRYEFGASSPDDFAGAFWTRINEDENNTKFQLLLTPDINRQEERIKVIIVKKENKENNLYKKIAVSNEIIFTNDEKIPDLSALEYVDGLAIRFDDPQRGRYFLYNRSGQIKNKGATGEKTLTAVFSTTDKNVYTKDPLNIDSGETLTWYFPKENSMIELNESNPVIEGQYYVVSQKSGNPVVHYKIKDYLATNYLDNTVIAKITKKNITYTATATMVFGLQGTSGSEYTIDFIWGTTTNNTLGLNVTKTNDIWEDITSANLDSKKKKNAVLECSLVLRDQDSIPIPVEKISNTTWQISWDSNEYLGPPGDQSRNNESKRKLIGRYCPILNSDKIISNNIKYYISNPVQQQDQFIYSLELDKFLSLDGKDLDQDLISFEDEGISYTKETVHNMQKYAQSTDADEIYELNFKEKSFLDSNDFQKNYMKYFIKRNGFYIICPYSYTEELQKTEKFYEPEELKYYHVSANEPLRLGQIDNNSFSFNNTIIINNNSETNNKTFLITNSGPDTDIEDPLYSISILKVELIDFGNYKLVAYFPIPIYKEYKTNDNEYRNIFKDVITPPYVYYLSSGEIDYLKDPFNIVFQPGWDFDISHYIGQSIPGEETQTDTGWALLGYHPNKSEAFRNSSDPNIDVPSLVTVNNNVVLQPSAIYFPDGLIYSIQYLQGGTCYYSQPVVVLQNQYPSSTINEWDGKSLVLDEDTGTILTSAIGAGKKEDDNKFTGVIIGDWSRSDSDKSISKQTGVYGFNHGAMSYAFKDDGTAFIGKDGRGRLHFNGNSSAIYSSQWLTNASGMFLDLDDGILKMQRIPTITSSGISFNLLFTAT